MNDYSKITALYSRLSVGDEYRDGGESNSIQNQKKFLESYAMIGEQLDIQGKLKPVERRLATLKKHLEQADIYFKYKGKKPLTEAEQILFTTAKDYLKGVMNGKTTIPTKIWKEEYTKLTAERKMLNQRYLALKEEVKEAEKIRKSVYSILRQEHQPRRIWSGNRQGGGIVNICPAALF